MPSPKTRRRVQESPPLSAAGSSITQRQRPTTTESSSFLHRYIVPLYSHLALESRYDALYILLLLSFEALFGILILQNVAYTEIDWVAYMQQVTLFHQQGERDYLQIRGDTGPLVYPAGFLYLFGVLYEWTQQGTNVRQAQVYFLGFYLMTQWLVMMLFLKRIQNMRQQLQVTKDWNTKSQTIHSIWLWRVAMGMLCLSKRLHSIYLLRLFNDGPTMMLLYASILLFQCQQWKLGCLLFSLAVSVKMNVLLFAPGLLLLLLQALPDLGSVVQMLLLYCALPQLVLGAPFLSTFPVSYLRKAFELDRVFFYKWTVNWKVRNNSGGCTHCELPFLLVSFLSHKRLAPYSVSFRRCLCLQATIIAAVGLAPFWTSRVCGCLATDCKTTIRPASLSFQTRQKFLSFTTLHCIYTVCIQLYWHCLCSDTTLSILLVVLSFDTVLVVDLDHQ